MSGQQSLEPIEKKTGFMIHGSTGCTCCRDENFIEGLYVSAEEAFRDVDYHARRGTVRSQYSKTGVYTVKEVQYELLPDGRVIIDKRVFDDEKFYETGNVAEELRYFGKEIPRV